MRHNVYSFILGAIASFAMAPNNLWPLLLIGLSGLYILTQKAPTPIKAALIGFLFSLGYFGFSLSWIGNALLVDDNPYWWAWPLAVAGLPIALSVFTACACYIYKKVSINIRDTLGYLIFVFLLFASEYARGNLFTGFPWNLYGYTWISVPEIAQTASLHNIYLLNVLTILWFTLPAYVLSKEHLHKIDKIILSFIGMTLLISCFVFGHHKLSNQENNTLDDYGFVIIQPNIKQSEKWKPENRAQNFMKLVSLSVFDPANTTEKKAYYIVWPETAISQDILNTEWAMNEIAQTLSQYPAPAYIITGALRYKDQKYYNSVITIDNKGQVINTYNKSHLVPFGEYMPLSHIFDIAPIVGFTGFEKGNGLESIELPEYISFTPFICYEVIFPNKTKFKSKPDFIVNVTNDAWYGKSYGPYQHLAQTQFKAIEANTRVLRSANTGISAIISKNGILQSSIELEQQGKTQ